MKLITLNLWGGRISHEYDNFFKKYPDVDMWCFQEVFNGGGPGDFIPTVEFTPNLDLHTTLTNYLTPKHAEFTQIRKNIYGLSTFLDQKIEIVEKGEILIAKGSWEEFRNSKEQDHNRKAQWFELKIDGQKILLVNTHFTHRPEGKKDSEKRLKQSKIVVEFLSMFDCPKILVGDLNLLPDTESIKIIEKAGMRNLIKEYDVTSTRTSLYKKDLTFADYIFVSPEIKVKDFKVLPDIVSDHAPVFLEFE